MAPQVARLPGQLEGIEGLVVLRVGDEAQQHLPKRLPVMTESVLRTLPDARRRGSVPQPVLVLDKLHKAPHLHHPEVHDRYSSEHGGPSITRGSSGRTEGAIWLRGAGSAQGRSGTG